jgi:hypothetical protein
MVGDNHDRMQRADRLRVGPWVPVPGRHADRAATDEITAEHPVHRPRAATPPRFGGGRPAAFDGPAGWLLDFGPHADELDDGGRGYRGYRRVARHRRVLALIAALVVSAALLLVVSALPERRNGEPGAGGGGARQSAATGPPVTYEADAPANTLFGSAVARTYPGASDGVIVQTLGNWGTGVGEGALRINDVMVPGAGMYALTFYYVLPNNEPTRSVITASGFGSVSVTVAGNATCCSSQIVHVVLDKGVNSITFSNPNGHAPAIDKIVINPL